jgi:proline racemase
MMRRVQAIDSHTGGEPTRLVIEGGPDLGMGDLAERLRIFQARHDRFRRAVVNEPRGSDVLVGGLLTPPTDPACSAAVIFFNNVGCLGMCGHGTIGLIATLAHLGRIAPGEHRVQTPVGEVTATLHADGAVSVCNVPSRRVAGGVNVRVQGTGQVVGDVAWGGNWFFLTPHDGPIVPARAAELTALAGRIHRAVNEQGFPLVDHVELYGPGGDGADCRNFVLCPGGAYDRSPCGTGTSAKLACLAADGELAEGQPWVQQSIVGSRFTGRYRWLDRSQGIVEPTITGTAHVTAESTLLLDERDPLCWGIG